MDLSIPLIQQLNEDPSTAPVEMVPTGHNYVPYTVNVEGIDIGVKIPIRESTQFEEDLSTCASDITIDEFKKILRKHRGLRD